MSPTKATSKIVLVNQLSTYLFIDIVNSFCKEYDEVVLFAGEVKPMNVALDPKVKVVSIAKYNKNSLVTRTFSWLFGFVKSIFLLNIYYRDYEVFVSSNPPLLNFIKLFCRNKVSLLVYDVYPDGLASGGFIKKNGAIYRIWSWLNKKSFKRLQSIITITNGMARALSSYIDSSKISVVPAWSNQNLSTAENAETENKFIKKYNLEDKFLIIYSGNLGLGYDLESLVYLAKEIKDNESIRILILGDGFKRGVIENLIRDYEISNCLLLPYQPANLFVSMLEAMHVGVVSLEKGAAQVAIPSKTYNILGAGKPVLCLGSKESDLATLIEESESGESFESDSATAIKSFVLKLFSDKQYYNQLSQNALTAASKFTFRNADLILENHIKGNK
jgi:glycosyltransferase involved in cell wall biosynthesis